MNLNAEDDGNEVYNGSIAEIIEEGNQHMKQVIEL